MTESHPGHTCVFGLMWGDEGKGKVVDLLAGAFDCVVRYNGGANAGHTVWIGTEKFALHLLPAGILRTGVVAVIGPGVVVDPEALEQEIDGLIKRGVVIGDQLKISDRAHLVMPWHKLEDQLSEGRAGDGQKLGTTVRGIGPCYAEKARRSGAIRFDDLVHEPDLPQRVRRIAADKQTLLKALYGHDAAIEVEGILRMLDAARARLSAFVGDTTQYLHQAVQAGRRLLFEGANGLLLDIDHGTFPYVTSSSTGPAGVACGSGVPPTLLKRTLGVTKAYATRVGSGPFVTELTDDTGERIRRQGHEYGTTTGRPRRCGWFDAVACRYSAQLGGATDVAVMHLDTLAGFERVGLCTAYECDGQRVDLPPAGTTRLERCRPSLEFFPGWGQEVLNARTLEELPREARAYLDRIEACVGVPVSIVSVGPERSQTLLRSDWRDLVENAARSR